ncbi:hypothetical protein ONA70_25020 [Micromonospora yasonensis]|uniref:hypothetical protein n=1 Tax=Micromonospora yasonensis TaxID=1128667 RepID=UPI002230332D|nr:hypothetical protein [Micromonospora yasonensis]MCW3843371.1 hypothetical protein [Micromonospora yasonensis]
MRERRGQVAVRAGLVEQGLYLLLQGSDRVSAGHPEHRRLSGADELDQRRRELGEVAALQSWFHVRLDEKDTPLFRYEYVHRVGQVIPAAHLQIHAHRDETIYLMTAADRGRPKARKQPPAHCERGGRLAKQAHHVAAARDVDPGNDACDAPLRTQRFPAQALPLLGPRRGR